MIPSRLGATLATACMMALVACSSDSTNAGSGYTAGMTATVNGSSFASTGTSFSYSGTTLSVVGTDLTTTISVSVGLVSAPGTYVVGQTSPVVIFIVSRTPSQGWDTITAGATGTVTITTLTATHVAGTFSFNAKPQSGTTGAMVVTQGSFDVTK